MSFLWNVCVFTNNLPGQFLPNLAVPKRTALLSIHSQVDLVEFIRGCVNLFA